MAPKSRIERYFTSRCAFDVTDADDLRRCAVRAFDADADDLRRCALGVAGAFDVADADDLRRCALGVAGALDVADVDDLRRCALGVAGALDVADVDDLRRCAVRALDVAGALALRAFPGTPCWVDPSRRLRVPVVVRLLAWPRLALALFDRLAAAGFEGARTAGLANGETGFSALLRLLSSIAALGW